MSISYYIKSVILSPLTREVFVSIFEHALKINAQLTDSPKVLADQMLDQLIKPDKFGFKIAKTGFQFSVGGETVGIDLYFDEIDTNSSGLMLSFESKKIYFDNEDDGPVDYNWYFKKFLYITDPYGIGYFEALMSNDDLIPLEEWIIRAFVSGMYHPELRRLEKDPLSRTEEDRLVIVQWLHTLMANLKRSRYDTKLIDIGKIAKSETSVTFTVTKQDITAHVEIKDYYFYIKPINTPYPRNIRPHLELLYTLCEKLCVYRYFAYNGIEKYYSEE